MKSQFDSAYKPLPLLDCCPDYNRDCHGIQKQKQKEEEEQEEKTAEEIGLEESGVERSPVFLCKDEERAIVVKQTNTGTVSTTTRQHLGGKLLSSPLQHLWAFPTALLPSRAEPNVQEKERQVN